MPLTCGCYDDGDADWYVEVPPDYTTLQTKRRKRCASCGELINLGAICVEYYRWRYPKDDVEERIWGEGEQVYMASRWHCERCADLFFSLEELGFCVSPDESMLELVKEYRDMAEDERLRQQLLKLKGGQA